MSAVFIVEGWSDHDQLQRAFGSVKTIVIHGTILSAHVLNEIERNQRAGNQVYMLLDPDSTGLQTAKRINRYYDLYAIWLDPNKCKCEYNTRCKYGIEYASSNYLREQLTPFVQGTVVLPEKLPTFDYIETYGE